MRLNKIEELIRLLEKSELNELEVTFFGGRKVRLSKNPSSSAVVVSNGQTLTTPAQKSNQESPSGDTSEQPKYTEIKSPIVGTLYRAPAPDAEPYVEVGDRVSVGQVVCIVEAMKLMNEIKSETNGLIKEIMVENAQPVEYGQVLFLVEPG